VEKLDAPDKKEFERGKLPTKLLAAVRAAWSRHLRQGWPPEGTCAVAAKVLKNPRDLAAWNNCLYGQEHKLPKRIRTAVFNALKKRGEEIHAAFFANDGEARLVNYLRVWQSQQRALLSLIFQATSRKADAEGNLDPEQYFLDRVAVSGTAISVGGLRDFLGGFVPVRLKNGAGTVYDETLGPDIVLLPNKGGLWASEARLNSFLKRLGRALESTRKRGAPLWEPDWLNNVDQTERYIVHGWCESIIVDGEKWPPLCLLTTPALVKFLGQCKVTHCKLARKEPRTIERAIQRLGLVRISRGRIRYVERRGGRFLFI